MYRSPPRFHRDRRNGIGTEPTSHCRRDLPVAPFQTKWSKSRKLNSPTLPQKGLALQTKLVYAIRTYAADS